MRPVISIGICVRNSEATIRRMIESTINQDFPHELIEIVVVDGHSSDRTMSIIQEELSKADMHYRVFYENSGLGYARQLVVDNAEGDLIVWVDGDLVLPTDFIRKQVEFMEKNPRVGIGKGKYGLHEEHSVVADLENVEFVLGFAREGETSSKALATAGSIFRVKAVRQAGGFDTSIKGVGEDMDVERRIKASGWLLCVTPAVFHEIRRSTWSSLWKEYFWHGHGGYYLFKKNKDFIEYYKMFPPILFIIELLKIPAAYRLLKRKVVFLLPFHYAFKRVAWIFGFLRNYLVTN